MQPEKLNIAVGTTKVGERVLMLRSTPTHSERVQNVLTQLFTKDNTTDIKTLKKYMFVPMTIVGDDDRFTLQRVLRTQQMFRQNVQHYIITNVMHIKTPFQVPIQMQENPPPPASDSNSSNPNHSEPALVTQEGENNNEPEVDKDGDTAMASPEATNTDDDAQSNFSTEKDPPTTEPYSLREWFYDLQDIDGESLIHSFYPSTDANKVYLLCEKLRAVKVLQLLLNLVAMVGLDFPAEALTVYFRENKLNPTVHNYPRATPQTTAYSNHLANYATISNPQEEMHHQHTPAQPELNRNSKRTRDGEIRNQNPPIQQTYVSAVNGQVYGTDIDQLLIRLNTNLQTLEEVDKKQQDHDKVMEKIEARFQSVEGDLEAHGKALQALADTQEENS